MTWSQTSPPCTREPPTGENKYTMALKERQIRRYKDKCHVIPEGQIRNLNGIETNLPEEGWIRYSILCTSEPAEFEKRKKSLFKVDLSQCLVCASRDGPQSGVLQRGTDLGKVDLIYQAARLQTLLLLD